MIMPNKYCSWCKYLLTRSIKTKNEKTVINYCSYGDENIGNYEQRRSICGHYKSKYKRETK